MGAGTYGVFVSRGLAWSHRDLVTWGMGDVGGLVTWARVRVTWGLDDIRHIDCMGAGSRGVWLG